MPLPTRIDPQWTCEQAIEALASWALHPLLIFRLWMLARRLEFGIQVFSGFRTRKEQQDAAAGNPMAAPYDRSTHTSCPATGADIRPLIAITDYVKARLGAEAMWVGLRWGGGAPVDSRGIPRGVEWMHVDLGPRET